MNDNFVRSTKKVKKEKLKLLFLIIFLGNLFFPLISFGAGIYTICRTEDCSVTDSACYGGLVPCGGVIWIGGGIDPATGECVGGLPMTYPESRCQLCHFFVMLDGILDFIFLRLVPAIAVLMLLIGGIMLFFAGGSPQTLSQAKSVITTTVIGLVIIFAAWLVVNTFLLIIGVNAWTGLATGWFSINCPIIIP